MTTLYVADDHSAMLHLWRRSNARGLRLLRFDAHCDLRGLVIDRVRTLAAARFDPRLLEGRVDGGNFLSHAVLDGRVRSIRWAFGPYGGRDRDLGSVAFCSDLAQRWLRPLRSPWVPFEFACSVEAGALAPITEGEDLDLDFDFFASRLAPHDSIEPAIEEFFQMEWPVQPGSVYLARSPMYCHALGGRVEGFIARLRERFSATVVELPAPPRARRPGRIERTGYRVDRLLRKITVGR